MSERLERLLYIYEDGLKPAHYDNPVDSENFKKIPKKFNNNDPSTYPSNRDQNKDINLGSYEQSARGNPAEMKEIREIIRRQYKSDKKSYLADDELYIMVCTNQRIKLYYLNHLNQ